MLHIKQILYNLEGILGCCDSQPRVPNRKPVHSQKSSGSDLTDVGLLARRK